MWKINHLSGVRNQASPKGQWAGNLKAFKGLCSDLFILKVAFERPVVAVLRVGQKEVLCSGCCLTWLFYRYFTNSVESSVNTFPAFQRSWSRGCVSPALGVLVQAQSCSPQSQVRRGTSTAFSKLSSHIPRAAGAGSVAEPEALPLHRILSRSCSSWFQFLCSPKRGTIHNLSGQSFRVTCPKGTLLL